MKIQKKLLYGIAALGATIALIYLYKKYSSGGAPQVMAGGGTPPATPVSATPSVTPSPQVI